MRRCNSIVAKNYKTCYHQYNLNPIDWGRILATPREKNNRMFQDHSRSLVMAAFDWPYTTSYWCPRFLYRSPWESEVKLIQTLWTWYGYWYVNKYCSCSLFSSQYLALSYNS